MDLEDALWSKLQADPEHERHQADLHEATHDFGCLNQMQRPGLKIIPVNR